MSTVEPPTPATAARVRDLLLSYQRRAMEAVNRKAAAPGAGVCGPPRIVRFPYGTGKSFVVMGAIEQMLEQERPQAIVAAIFCKTYNVATWADHLQEHLPHLRIFTRAPHAHFELQQASSVENATSANWRDGWQQSVLLLSHDAIRMQRRTLDLISKEISMLVIDECTAFKNRKSKRSQLMHEFSASFSGSTPRILLSGKLVTVCPTELWSQFQVAYPHSNPLGSTFYKFTDNFFIKTEHGWVVDPNKESYLVKVMRRYVLQMTPEEMAEHREFMGDISTVMIAERFGVRSEQQEALEFLERNWALPLGNSDQIEMYDHSMQVWHKHRQITGGFYYTGKQETGNRATRMVTPDVHPVKAHKLAELVKDLLSEDQRRKIVVWYYYAAELEIIRQTICSWHLAAAAVYDTTSESMQAFAEDPNTSIAVLQVGKSAGLNKLVSADTCIFYSGTYSPEDREQAIARLVRPGQAARQVRVIDMACTVGPDSRIVSVCRQRGWSEVSVRKVVDGYFSERRQQDRTEE